MNKSGSPIRSTYDRSRPYPQDDALSRALMANAVFSTLSGIAFLGASGTVAALLGAVPELPIQFIGGNLVAFGLVVAVVASRRPVLAPVALAITVADVLWVVGSVAGVVLGRAFLTGSGVAAILGVAGIVAIFALLQLRGLVRYARNVGGRSAARSRFMIRRPVPAPPEVVWPRLQALDRIGEHFDELVEVNVREIDGVIHRTCAKGDGDRWTEQVLMMDDDTRELVLRFDTETGDFPIPLQQMIGGWRVQGYGEESMLELWYEFTVRGGLVGEVMAALMDVGLAKQLMPVFQSLGAPTGGHATVGERDTTWAE